MVSSLALLRMMNMLFIKRKEESHLSVPGPLALRGPRLAGGSLLGEGARLVAGSRLLQ